MTTIVIAILRTVGGQAQEEYIAKLSAVADFSREHEPGVTGYAICVPRDEPDAKTVFMVEIYKDAAAIDAHMHTDIVQSLIQWTGTHTVLDGAPSVTTLNVLGETGLLVRADVLKQTVDPYILVSDINYKEADLLEQSLPYWVRVADTARTAEPGSLLYGLMRDPANISRLMSVEAFADKDALWEVHAKSAAVQENVRQTTPWRSVVKHHFLKKQYGFLGR